MHFGTIDTAMGEIPLIEYAPLCASKCLPIFSLLVSPPLASPHVQAMHTNRRERETDRKTLNRTAAHENRKRRAGSVFMPGSTCMLLPVVL